MNDKNRNDEFPTVSSSGQEQAASFDAFPVPDIEGYTIVRKIAVGGMGAVYEARQESPRRKVALKVIRPEVMSPALMKRFNLEVEVLGRLEHPAIGRIYEAGSVEKEGRVTPFFAMEFIEGLPITEYVHKNDLPLGKRIGLLLDIAAGIQHAHQKGVIHRDLKPANILVGADGKPKILDFGVARLTESDIALTTMPTDIGLIVGTLQYMSPEQATGDVKALDTRSDIYSLGVIAYELLAGQRPYQLEKKLIHEAARIIIEQEPTRLSSINRILRGDLETIVGKSMEKDKNRRYASASDFANDLMRYLQDQPIAARPPSTWYQLHKFAKRNKLLVASAAAIFLAVVAGSIASTLGFVRARAAERVAVAEREKAEYQQRVAQERLYDSLIAEGTAQAALGSWSEARRQYREARSLAKELNLSDLLARAGLWEAGVHAPEPGRVLTAERGHFLAAAVEDNGDVMVVRDDGTVSRIAADGSGVKSSWTLPQPPRSVFLTRDARILLAVNADGTVESRDAHDATPITTFTKIAEQPRAIALSDDGRIALLGFADGRVEVYEGSGGKPVHVLRDHRTGILSLAISADGTRALSGSEDRTAIVWDLVAGRETWIFRGHRDWVFAADLSADGKLAVTGCGDFVQAYRNPILAAWETDTGVILQSFHPNRSGIAHVRFSRDEKRILAGTFLSQSKVWEVATGAELFALDEPGDSIRQSAFAPGGGHVVTLAGNRITTWSLNELERHFERPSRNIFISDVALTPDEQTCAVGDRNGVLRVFNTASGKQIASFDTGKGEDQYVAYLPDGKRLVLGYGRTLAVLDVANEKLTTQIDTGGPTIRALALAPDASAVAIAGDAGFVALWDLKSTAFTRTYTGFDGSFRALAVSGDGTLLIGAGEGRDVRMWNVSSGEPVHLFADTPCDGSGVLSLAISGKHLLAGSETGEVRLYDIEARRHVRTFRSSASGLEDITFVPDSPYALSVDWYGRVNIWNWNIGESVREIKGQSAAMVTIDVMKNGNWLATRTGGVWLHDLAAHP